MSASPRPTPRRQGPALVAWFSVVAFLVVLAFLALQMRAGRDPALRAVAERTAHHRRAHVRHRVERPVVVPDLAPPESDVPIEPSTPPAVPVPAQPPVVTRSS